MARLSSPESALKKLQGIQRKIDELYEVVDLVAPRTLESEGSQGRGSDALERGGLTYCLPRTLDACE